jgi:hypothetical protein
MIEIGEPFFTILGEKLSLTLNREVTDISFLRLVVFPSSLEISRRILWFHSVSNVYFPMDQFLAGFSRSTFCQSTCQLKVSLVLSNVSGSKLDDASNL